MRYALTYQYGVECGYEPTWHTTETVIVEAKKGWFENEEAVAKVLRDSGVKPDDVNYIMDEDKWFVRNVEDVDVYYKEERSE